MGWSGDGCCVGAARCAFASAGGAGIGHLSRGVVGGPARCALWAGADVESAHLGGEPGAGGGRWAAPGVVVGALEVEVGSGGGGARGSAAGAAAGGCGGGAFGGVWATRPSGRCVGGAGRESSFYDGGGGCGAGGGGRALLRAGGGCGVRGGA